METSGPACPDCGHLLAPYRRDLQTIGAREALLQWALCTSCGHVSLQEWHIRTAEESRLPAAV